MNFTEKLKKHKEDFENSPHKYEKKSMPEVLDYLKIAKEKVNGNTVFNAELTRHIAEKENITETELIDHIDTEVYLAQHDYNAEQDEIYKQKMLTLGFLELKPKTEYRGKIEMVANASCDWLTSKVTTQATLTEAGNGELFAIPKGKRSRGYYVRKLDNAFYKPLTK